MIASVSPVGPMPAPVQANITGYWHQHAVAYDEHPMSRLHMGPAKDAWAEVWRAALPAWPADVLDVGTGTGQVALLLAELGHRVTGIDWPTACATWHGPRARVWPTRRSCGTATP